MSRGRPFYVLIVLLLCVVTSCAQREDKLANENDRKGSISVEALMQMGGTMARGNTRELTSIYSSAVLSRSRDDDSSYDYSPVEKDYDESFDVMAETTPIDWEYYLSITGPDEAPYMLLYYNEELEEVEYLYPMITIEEFLDEAEPTVFAIFSASWFGQEDELKKLVEDMVDRYDKVLFIEVDADQLPRESLERCLVRELPLFLVFQEGKIMSQVEGYHSGFSSAIEKSLVDILES